MFEPIRTCPDRARVRLRDLAAAWVLVALVLGMSVLPAAVRAAKAEAIHVATVLHSVPKLLQGSHQA
jgi:hypothetical protein